MVDERTRVGEAVSSQADAAEAPYAFQDLRRRSGDLQAAQVEGNSKQGSAPPVDDVARAALARRRGAGRRVTRGATTFDQDTLLAVLEREHGDPGVIPTAGTACREQHRFSSWQYLRPAMRALALLWIGRGKDLRLAARGRDSR